MSTTDDLRSVLPNTAEVNKAGHLAIGGCDTVELAEQFGTPLFVFCERTFVDRAGSFRASFDGATIYYAAKAFLSKAICRLVEREGLGLDVASGGELHTALAAGFPPARMVMHGNNKQDSELETAIGAGIGRIAVDNLEEIDRIAAVARAAGRRQPVFLRVTPGITADTHAHIRTGHHESKFGLPIQGGVAREAIIRANASPDLELRGLHAHIGSNIFDPDPFQETIEVLFTFMAKIKAEFGLEFPELNLGGGFGVPFVAGDVPFDVKVLGDLVLSTARKAAESNGITLPALCFEPGRWLISNSMVTLYTVGAIKETSKELTFVSVDGGMSDNIRPALYQAQYAAILANKATEDAGFPVTLAGMHCESGDLLAEGLSLPRSVARGDLVAMPATGAYAYSMASNYNKKPRPAVVTVADGVARPMIRRETYEDLV
ncbi:MAG TPA: diaminopimelate decarboxylase, partial [Actinomycetota bacterium]|nr:diaminopimelate decarboxylase [Actinomycetota bacterium]